MKTHAFVTAVSEGKGREAIMKQIVIPNHFVQVMVKVTILSAQRFSSIFSGHHISESSYIFHLDHLLGLQCIDFSLLLDLGNAWGGFKWFVMALNALMNKSFCIYNFEEVQ